MEGREENEKRKREEEQHGAWGTKKAPVAMITDLLKVMEDGDMEKAEVQARQILEYEPSNQTILQLAEVIKEKMAMTKEKGTELKEEKQRGDGSAGGDESDDEEDKDEDEEAEEEQ